MDPPDTTNLKRLWIMICCSDLCTILCLFAIFVCSGIICGDLNRSNFKGANMSDYLILLPFGSLGFIISICRPLTWQWAARNGRRFSIFAVTVFLTNVIWGVIILFLAFLPWCMKLLNQGYNIRFESCRVSIT